MVQLKPGGAWYPLWESQSENRLGEEIRNDASALWQITTILPGKRSPACFVETFLGGTGCLCGGLALR